MSRSVLAAGTNAQEAHRSGQPQGAFAVGRSKLGPLDQHLGYFLRRLQVQRARRQRSGQALNIERAGVAKMLNELE